MKELYVVKYDDARKQLRKEFAKLAIENESDAIGSLETLNCIAADHNYDAMSVVLSIISGTASSPNIENSTVKSVFSDLKTLFTALDIIIEVHNDFVDVLSNGNTELLQDTLMRKFEEYSQD